MKPLNLVPEERKGDGKFNHYKYALNREWNACRTEVLNNLKSKEMVGELEDILDQYIHRMTACVSKSEARRIYFTNRKELALAIQKALIQ